MNNERNTKMNATQETLKELMDTYTKSRNAWIDRFGSDRGFDKWFTHQVTKARQPGHYEKQNPSF